jgi:hypothetical protein
MSYVQKNANMSLMDSPINDGCFDQQSLCLRMFAISPILAAHSRIEYSEQQKHVIDSKRNIVVHEVFH